MTALLAGSATRRRAGYWVALAVGAAVLVAFLLVAFLKLLGAGAFAARRWRPFTDHINWGFLLHGYLTNLRAGLFAGMFTLVAGTLLGLGRMARSPWLRWPVTLWIEMFRSLPLLFLILFSYILLPRYTGTNYPPVYYGVLALTVYNSAVLAEIVRAGVLSLDRGQREAAFSLGLGYWKSMRLVLLPQALRRMVPALVSQIITLLKDTSLLFVITVQEMVRNGRALAARYQNPFQVYVMVGLIFLVVNLALSLLARRLEVRQRRRYRAGAMRVAGVEDLTALEIHGDRALNRDA